MTMDETVDTYDIALRYLFEHQGEFYISDSLRFRYHSRSWPVGGFDSPLLLIQAVMELEHAVVKETQEPEKAISRPPNSPYAWNYYDPEDPARIHRNCPIKPCGERS